MNEFEPILIEIKEISKNLIELKEQLNGLQNLITPNYKEWESRVIGKIIQALMEN